MVGDRDTIRREPVLLHPFGEQGGGQLLLVVQVVLGRHGELCVQQHGVEGGRGEGSGVRGRRLLLLLEDLAEVLLVEVRVEDVGVRVGGLFDWGTEGHPGAGGGTRRLLLLLVVLADEG